MDPVSFGRKVKIKRLCDLPVRVRPERGQPYAGALVKGEEYDALLDPDFWLRIPAFQNMGLYTKEWKDHWDELRVEVFHPVGASWLPLEEDSDWRPYLPSSGGVLTK